MSPPSSPSTPTPYYTVVGSSADRVVAADGLDDYSWTNYVGSYYWSYATASTSASAEKTPKSGGGLVGLGKSLTRKVSSRWRRTGSVVTTEGRSQGEGVIKTTLPPATPAQDPQGISERSGSAGPEEPAKTPLEIGREHIKRMRSRHTMRISVDRKPGDGNAPSSPLPTTPTPDTPTSFESVRVPRRLVKPRPSLSSADPSPSRGPSSCISASASTSRCIPSEKEGGGKLWKLMKRISTGGLKDKYHSHSSSKSHLSNYSEESLSHASSSANERAPPVPALPKGLRVLLPSASSPASPISVSSDGYSPRTSGMPKTSCDVQGRARIVEKDRSASSPVSILPSSSSPAGSQKKLIQRLRPISSLGALRRRPSTSSGFSASVSAGRGPIPSSTPSGQIKPHIPSRPSTANATSSSLEPTRFFSSIGKGRSRSVHSKHSSISSVDDANGHHNILHPSPQNQQHNQSHQHFHQQLHQQHQSNNKPNVNNGVVPVPPMPTNILAKHIVPPGELLKGPPGHGSAPSITMTPSSVSKDKAQGTRRKERESILTRLMQSGGGNANGKGSGSSSSGKSADNGGPSHISGLSKGRPSKVGLYLELPSRSATSPLPRINDLDKKSPSIRVPTPIPSPGRSASLGGFEWSIARSPEYELPSLPVPPRRRAAEKAGVGDDGASVNGNEKVSGRGRSLTVAASPLSSPTSSRVPSTSSPPRVESPSSISSSAAGSGEYFSPALSTFGRVVGKQFGMERIEDPSFVSTPASFSSVSSSIGSGRNRRMSISGSISHFLSKSPRPGSSSASAVARSFSSPSSSDLPLSSSVASVPSWPSQPSLPLASKPVPRPSTPSSPGTFNTLLRKLSFSGNAPASLPPARPARNPTRPSISISATSRDGKKEEKDKEKTKLGGGKPSLKGESGKDNNNGPVPASTTTNGSDAQGPRRFLRNADTATDTDVPNYGFYSQHRKSQSCGKSSSLTEKEKRARWKDLLARSERAGGTIHLSADGEGLLSDKMSVRASSAVSLVTGEEEAEEEERAVLEGAAGY